MAMSAPCGCVRASARPTAMSECRSSQAYLGVAHARGADLQQPIGTTLREKTPSVMISGSQGSWSQRKETNRRFSQIRCNRGFCRRSVAQEAGDEDEDGNVGIEPAAQNLCRSPRYAMLTPLEWPVGTGLGANKNSPKVSAAGPKVSSGMDGLN